MQAKFTSIAWTHDHKGFFYNRYPEPKYVTLDTKYSSLFALDLILLKLQELGFDIFLDDVRLSRKRDSTDAGTETEINLFHELYYHFLGTEQSEDILCWREPEYGSWLTDAKVSEDGQVC